MDTNTILRQLADPFPIDRVHWRVHSTNQKRVIRETGDQNAKATKGQILAYVDARDVMDRLDEVVGPDRWQDEYKETPSGRVICVLGLLLDAEDDRWSEWVYKSDGAGATDFEGEKGAISDAFKRAAVKWGVGRYLYGLAAPWVDLDDYGRLPKNFDGTQYLKAYRPLGLWEEWRMFTDAMLEHTDSILKIKHWLSEDEFDKAIAELDRIPNADKMALNRAWTKGGPFTTRETKQIKYGNNDFEKSRKAAA